VGKRGEVLFRSLITRWCGGRPWFDEVFLGEQFEARDFMVNLVEPSTVEACFFVQVKATALGYTGSGVRRRLRVQISRRDIETLKNAPGPAFVVGMDIHSDRKGYIVAVTKSSKGFSSLPTRHPLNCRTLRRLWREVDEYWMRRKMLPDASAF
jgi:hypothetical protein